MSAVDRLACALGRRDEIPNVELAHALVSARDREGVQELVDALAKGPAPVAADAIKVLYEVGERDSSLISPYAAEFAALLTSKNNRMVWGAASALYAISLGEPRAITPHLHALMSAVTVGSVITADRGIGAIANAALDDTTAIDFVLNHLRTCGAKYVPFRSEQALPAITARNAPQFTTVLKSRLKEQSVAGQVRLERVLRTLAALQNG
jgi:hypothetical protein